MVSRSALLLVLFMPLLAFADSAQDCGQEAKACLQYGARIFQQRCSLCHGSDGLGEGILPLSVPDYPATNLLEPKYAKDIAGLKEIVVHGTQAKGTTEWMPPWGDELTHTQMESVVQFVQFMRDDLEGALKMSRSEAAQIEPSIRIGRAVFIGRCALCHGKFGQGDGKMARIIKDPPPFNLVLSRMPDEYLTQIITKGGEAMGRSARMPPWGGDLTGPEIQSVILYIKTLREE